MVIFLTIVQYLIQSVVDVGDKFLISARKIEPASYTFFTVVTGVALLLIWPFAYHWLPAKFIFLNLLSGGFFSLTLYVFYVALAQGEVSRVVPFVFGLVPVFDLLIGKFTGRNVLNLHQVAAVFLLIPGALLISHKPGTFSQRRVGLKVLSAFLFSSYYALWQYGAQSGPALNNLMWNRLGAAAVLTVLLIFPLYRKKVFGHLQDKQKGQTSLLFLFKQILGGANFIFLSELLVVGKIAVINALSGFRYLFLFLFSLFLSSKHKEILDEHIDRHTLRLKLAAMALICGGTVMLFWKL